MAREISDLLPPKPSSRLRIYAWTPDHPPLGYAGLIKVGQTTKQNVAERIRQSQGQMQQAFTVHVDALAERKDGSTFRDTDVIARLVAEGFENPHMGSSREWVRCTPDDVHAAIKALQTGQALSRERYQTFAMRPEQAEAVARTREYYESIWSENPEATPRFLWNAKMRFGKTFTAYQLARQIKAKRVLVVTFKPAVQDAWHEDLTSHVDFAGWQYRNATTMQDSDAIDRDRPLVYFGSFQDLLGKERGTEKIKSKNEWVHSINWDLVVFDEYHFGAWRESANNLFEQEDDKEFAKELTGEYRRALETFGEELEELGNNEEEFLPITTRAYLYLSGTPFKALGSGEFIEEQIFNWTYTDEQRAKRQWASDHPHQWNPYGSLPEMRLMTYQMPDDLLSVAHQGEFDEFDLNEFFAATGTGRNARFTHEDDVQKWLNLIRGEHAPTQLDSLKAGTRPPFPYADARLLPYLQHSFWFLPNVAACHAMANLLQARQNTYWHAYRVVIAAGANAGVGVEALPPVRAAIGDGHDTQTITLSCGKLTTGVTVKEWSSILMLRNLSSPETYFQAAFRVQSPWSIKNPDGDDPNREEILKPVAFVFDFAPTRALRQLADYGASLNPQESNPENAVAELVNFLPVLAYDGANMTQIDAGALLDIAMSGTSATLLARKWESAILVNVDNRTLQKIMDNNAAMQAIMNIEGFRALGQDIFETVVNKSEKVSKTKKEQGATLSKEAKKELTAEEKEYKSKRKQIQEKLIKFATRIPAFMYLTDFRENTLQDVITKIEPELFKQVTGLTVGDFELLVQLGVFNSIHMNQAVFAFRRYEDASLSYTGIRSHKNLRKVGLYDTVITLETAD
ncbi:DEAD/DEAH box helicase family protein [Pseudoglutamicibacter cumminsii]|uniref:DEAD/DEAH box helicase family protein n=1 Tax=Pseudoglutamicibacter cumminsii TaxID=156979 RepID=UPI0025569F35|nr:DEAD/DEAH box helicase family protein [Pseudoglutamicibacter cumminsii]MDZ3744527.1 DEAD/DEAH box helicase family protein [Pseudoglutamicibacter cumminsii]